MCEVCGRRRCIPACPEFSGRYVGRGRIRAVCSICGEVICVRDKLFRKNEITLCIKCAEISAGSENGLGLKNKSGGNNDGGYQ